MKRYMPFYSKLNPYPGIYDYLSHWLELCHTPTEALREAGKLDISIDIMNKLEALIVRKE